MIVTQIRSSHRACEIVWDIQFSGLRFDSCDDNHTICGPWTVKGGRSGILKDGDGLDTVRVEII